ncbi:hypothetical protein PFISCL1PPCAC_2622, partial [Pristionchus fissidentatus]
IVLCGIEKSKKKAAENEPSSSPSDPVEWALLNKVDSCAGCKRRLEPGPVVACHQQVFHFTCPCKCNSYKRIKNKHGSDIAIMRKKGKERNRFRTLNMDEESDRKIYDIVHKAYNDAVEAKRKESSTSGSNSRGRFDADGGRKTSVDAVGM